MIVPPGNGGDTRLSVPVPARAVHPLAAGPSARLLFDPPGVVCLACRPPAQLLRFATKNDVHDLDERGQVAPVAALSPRPFGFGSRALSLPFVLPCDVVERIQRLHVPT